MSMQTVTESFDCPACGNPKGYLEKGPDLEGIGDGWLYMDWTCECGAEGTDVYRVQFAETEYVTKL